MRISTKLFSGKGSRWYREINLLLRLISAALYVTRESGSDSPSIKAASHASAVDMLRLNEAGRLTGAVCLIVSDNGESQNSAAEGYVIGIILLFKNCIWSPLWKIVLIEIAENLPQTLIIADLRFPRKKNSSKFGNRRKKLRSCSVVSRVAYQTIIKYSHVRSVNRKILARMFENKKV